MAAPITHLFFADKFCSKYWEIDKFQFFAWNCLPDIRYVDKMIERTKFHTRNVTIYEVLQEESDFWKGVKFHSFIDENRGMYCRKNIYILEDFDGNMIRSLKFLEDDILYWKLFFRQDFIKFLFGYKFPIYDIDLESIKKWKDVLSDYFSEQPSKDSRNNFCKRIGLTEDIRIKNEVLIDEFRWKYIQHISDMIVFLESNIK